LNDDVPALFHIRAIDPNAEVEIDLVAQRMRATLIEVEVEGEDVGTALYTMDWLRDRVRWHHKNPAVTAAVLLATNDASQIVGHTIVRQETGASGEPYGYVSTTYVDPAWRRRGIADALLVAGETWFHQHGLQDYATVTSSTNDKLIRLYRKHAYHVTAERRHDTMGTVMISLTKHVPNVDQTDAVGRGT